MQSDDSQDTREMDYDEKMHDIRQKVDAIIGYVGNVKNDTRYEKGKREIALVYTKLQEAKMWAGKVLEEIGQPLPAEFQDKAK